MANKKKKNNKSIRVLGVLIGALFLIWLALTCLDGESIPVDSSLVTGSEEQNPVGQQTINNVDNTEQAGENNFINNETENQMENQAVENEVTEPDETESEVSTGEIDEPDEGTEESDEPETEGQGDASSESVDSELDPSTLSNTSINWSYGPNTEHKPPVGYTEGVDIAKYDAYYLVKTDDKVIFLTFDAGYDLGFTSKILDALKANDVQAIFFVTKSFIRDHLDLAKRMKEEGHLVGNHSVSHPEFPTLSDDQVADEIEETARYFEEMTGYKMDPFFRPPQGKFSERTLYLTKNLGYKTIFWSLAYRDWETDNQKGKEYAYNFLMQYHHAGAIPLLHVVSQSNADAMDSIIKGLKEEGYQFGSAYEIE